MKLRWIGLVTLLAIAGCNGADTPTPSSPSSSPPPVQTSTYNPTSPTPPDSKPATPATSSADHTGKNPDRINQLHDLRTVNLTLATTPVTLWIMDNESKREEGMMFLKDSEVKETQGMIFVFTDVQDHVKNGFWMHNCPMGLDIIYISKNKKIVNVGDGPPESDKTVPPVADYFYVIEMKRGWSKRHGLKAGDSVPIPASVKTDQ